MNEVEKLLKYLCDTEIAESLTLVDGTMPDTVIFDEVFDTESVDGKHLTGTSMNIDKMPEGGRTIQVKKVIDARKDSLNYELKYDEKRKCYVKVKKI